MRAHCSNIANFLAYAIFNCPDFLVINAIKKKKKTSFNVCNPKWECSKQTPRPTPKECIIHD